jgi:predicted N-acetyltransferase YhbS
MLKILPKTEDSMDIWHGALTIRRAIDNDVDAVIAILSEAATWLLARGIRQWPSPFPRQLVEHDIKNNKVWLATHQGQDIATASLIRSDPMFWGDHSVNAWYLHRFAVRRSTAGVGHNFLRWIEGQAISSGVQHMRLDCGTGLRSYYERTGYRLVSSVSLVAATSAPPRSEWFCYEKDLLPDRLSVESSSIGSR